MEKLLKKCRKQESNRVPTMSVSHVGTSGDDDEELDNRMDE